MRTTRAVSNSKKSLLFTLAATAGVLAFAFAAVRRLLGEPKHAAHRAIEDAVDRDAMLRMDGEGGASQPTTPTVP